MAHRGSSALSPEHTLAAYRRALDEGADALECDVRLTRDGHLVCVHDRRVDRTSSGSGPVSTLQLAQLSELDFASWRGLPAPAERPESDGAGVLTFARLLELVLDFPKRVELHVETKHPNRYAGLVEQTLVRVLREYEVIGAGSSDEGAGNEPARNAALVTAMSFAPLGLRRFRLLAPELPTALLVRHKTYAAWREGVLPPGVHIAGPSITTVRRHPRYVSRLHARGHRVHVWTVDQQTDLDLVLELGVDAIITNRPAEVLQRLGRV